MDKPFRFWKHRGKDYPLCVVHKLWVVIHTFYNFPCVVEGKGNEYFKYVNTEDSKMEGFHKTSPIPQMSRHRRNRSKTRAMDRWTI